ncbi:MAG: hypothetical protein KI793_25740 [Rivularia sp. (in: Bacteria)]|nr:hypothetical protein [Rivularia sp. MS3]
MKEGRLGETECNPTLVLGCASLHPTYLTTSKPIKINVVEELLLRLENDINRKNKYW